MTANNKTQPKVLVLLASYNGRKWIEAQLRSIFEQEEVDVKVIVGDDMSTDGTLEYLEAMALQEPRLQLIKEASASGSAANNFRRLFKTVQTNDYDFVALSDQDDLWYPRKLARAIERLRESGADGYSSSVSAEWEDGTKKVLTQSRRKSKYDFLFEGAGQGCTFVLKAYVFDKVRAVCIAYPDASGAMHYHDWLIYLVVRVSGGEWHFDHLPSISYRQHGGNEIGARGGIASVAHRLRLIRNGWFKKQVLASILMVNLLDSAKAEYDPEFRRFDSAFRQSPSLSRTFKLGRFVFQNGRRKLADRIVLVFAVALAWW